MMQALWFSALFLVPCLVHYASATPSIKFTIALQKNPLPKAHDLLLVSLLCGYDISNSSMNISDDDNERFSSLSDPPLDTNYKFYLMLNDSRIDPNSTSLTTYSSLLGENGKLMSYFYLPQLEYFVGKFTCVYNSTNTSNQIASDAMLVYAPVPLLGRFMNIHMVLYIIFSLLFAFTLLSFAIHCFVFCHNKNRHPPNSYQKSISKTCTQTETGLSLGCTHDYDEMMATTRSDSPLLFTTSGIAAHSCDSSCETIYYEGGGSYLTSKPTAPYLASKSPAKLLISEELVDEMIAYLKHPSSCKSTDCLCSYFKQKLNSFSLSAQNGLCTRNYRTPQPVESIAIPIGSPLGQYGGYTDHTTQGGNSKFTHSNHTVIPLDTTSLAQDGSPPFETVTFDSQGGTYANEDHEIYLRVPRDAIPKGRTISIEVGVSLNSSLVSLLPPGTTPISPIVKLCVIEEDSFRFLKPVILTLPHFLDISNEEDVEKLQLQFMKMGHYSNSFHKSNGSISFCPQSNTATLKTMHFCSFCITAKENISVDKINFRLVKVVPRARHLTQWRASFCITYYLRTCLQALKKQFPELEYEIKTLRRFKFADSTRHIEIEFDRTPAVGWLLALETKNKISSKDVKYWNIGTEQLEMMEEEKQYPPRFEIQVSSFQAKEPTNVSVYFKGMADNGTADVTELLLQPIMQKDEYELKSRRLECGLMDSPLHRDLMNHVAVSLATKWRIVGVQLGLSVAKLDEIEVAYVNDCKRCFSAVFSEWENTASLPYTWSTIIEVLKTPSVEENRLAERLKAQFTTNYDAVSLSSKRSSTYSQSSGYSTEN